MRALWSRVTHSHGYRVWMRFADAGGNVMAAGMSFQMLFAVFAGVWVLFAAASSFFAQQPQVKEATIGIINLQVPGLIDSNGPILPGMLDHPSTMTTSGILALIATLYTAIAWFSYARAAVRRIFDLPATSPTNFLLQKGLDLGLALAYGVVVVLSAIGSAIATQAVDEVVVALGGSSTSTSLIGSIQVFGFFVVLVFDTAILGLLIRVLSGVNVPWRRLITGALMGGLALGILKIIATVYISGSTENPLFASVALFIGLLLWFNLSSRVVLLAAAWVATERVSSGEQLPA